MKKTLYFLSRLISSLFFIVLFVLIGRYKQIIDLNLGFSITLVHLFVITFLAVIINLIKFLDDNELKIAQAPSAFKSTVKDLLPSQKTLKDFWEKKWIKWELMPFVLLMIGLGVSLYFFLNDDEAFSVLTVEHGSENIIETEDFDFQVEDKIVGHFIAAEDNLGIVAVKFDTGGESIDDRITFRIKEKGKGWHYKNTYKTDQFQNNKFFPFGFPKLENSQEKEFIFELIIVGQEPDKAVAVSSKKPNLQTKYKFSSRTFQEDKPALLRFIYKKLFYQIKRTSFLAICSVFLIPLLIYRLFLFYLYLSPKRRIYFLNKHSKIVFLTCLFFLVLSQLSLQGFSLLPISLELRLEHFSPFLFYTAIFSGILLFSLNEEKLSERRIILLGFFILVIVFVYLRSLSFGNSPIEMGNYDKARSYLPSAINAFFQKDFFHYRNYFYSGIENNNSGPYYRLPFYAWLFYPFLYLKDLLSFDILMKTFLTLLDGFILIIFYKIAVKSFGNLIGFTTTLLFTVNPYFQFHFLPPVLDGPGLLFFLLSILANLNKKNTLGYFLAGFSGLAKESFFLISLPFHFTLTLFKKTDVKDKGLELIKLLFFSLTPYVLFKFLGPKISTGTQPLLYFSLFWSLLASLFLLDKKFSPSIKKFLGNNKRGKWYYIIPMAAVCISCIFLWSENANFSNNFLTDSKIIFKWRMYYSILKQQEDFFPKIFWCISLLGIVLSLLVPSKTNKISLALGVSGLTYLIIASKSIFFHYYYRHIFVIYMIFLFGVVLLKIKSFFNKKATKFFVIFLMSFSVVIPTANMTKKYLNRIGRSDSTKGYQQLAEYLREETDYNEKILTNGKEAFFGATLYSFRFPANFKNMETLRKEIRVDGFVATMKKYNVNWYVSKEPSDFEDLLSLFENISKTNEITRTEHILLRINDENWGKYVPGTHHDLRREYNTTKYLQDKEIVMDRYNPRQYFHLEKIIGDFYIYKLNEEGYLPESNF